MEGGTTQSTVFYCIALLPPHRPPREDQPGDNYADPWPVRDNKEIIEENGVCACIHVCVTCEAGFGVQTLRTC